MSDTVKKIVYLMFDEIEETEETLEMREEVLNDCQAQYEDLIDRGLSEDEAVQAVVESLSGMEEALADFPRKQPMEHVADKDDLKAESKAGESEKRMTCRELDVRVRNADVTLAKGSWPGVAVRVENDPEGVISVEETNGRVTIAQHNLTEHHDSSRSKISFTDWSEFGRSLVDMAVNLAQKATAMIVEPAPKIMIEIGSGMEHAEIVTTSGCVEGSDLVARRVKISTTSGCIQLTRSGVAEADLSTASGDVCLGMQDGYTGERFMMKTMSGDVTLKGCAESISLSSMSGDVDMHGDSRELILRSTSGDVSVNGRMIRAELRTTSGDVDVQMEDAGPMQTVSVSASSTSGDVEIILPPGVQKADIRLKTVSGDRIAKDVIQAADAPVRVELNSVSGDVTVRGR